MVERSADRKEYEARKDTVTKCKGESKAEEKTKGQHQKRSRKGRKNL